MEIVLTDANAMDEISIRTRCNAYRFFVIDPSRCRGFLNGGLLGSQPRDAFLAGAILPGSGCISDSPRLETGGRAVFYMNGKYGVDRLITSPILQLQIFRHANDTVPGRDLLNRSEDSGDSPPLMAQGCEQFAGIA